jgi:hypothetical protein
MPELFGRQHEIGALGAQLSQALAGAGGCVLLSGEPGIGKTSLLDQLAADARAAGMLVAWGTCWDGDGAPGYWPWQRVLSAVGATVSLGDLRGTAAGDFGFYAAVADRLRAVAAPAGLLVVVDDLHWADEECLALLKFLARDLHPHPVLMAAAFRSGALAKGGPLRELVSDSSAVRLHLPLSGLAPAAVAQVLADQGGETAPEVSELVAQRTAGNPFFVREVAHALGTGQGPLPSAIAEAVSRRVRALPGGSAEVLQVAAVIGREFEDDLLRSAVKGADPALASAEADQLVERTRPGAHRFVHDLVREQLIELPENLLRTLNLRVADTLEALPETGVRSGRLAAHLMAAGPLADPGRVVAWSDAAAHEALEQRSYADAARHLGVAVDIAGTGGEIDRERRLDLADALLRAGRLGEARSTYDDVLGDPDETPRNVARAALGIHETGQLTGGSRHELVATLDRARQTLTEEPALRARVTAAMAREIADGADRDPERAADLAAEALAEARMLGDPSLLAACLFARHDVIWGPGTARERRDLGEELMRTAEIGAPDLVFQGALCRYVALLELADPEAGPALVQVEELAVELGQPLFAYLARTRRDAWDVMTGSADVEQRIRASWAESERLGVPDGYGVFVTQLIALDLTNNDPAQLVNRQRELGGRLMPPDFGVEETAFELMAAGDLRGAAETLSRGKHPAGRTLFRWRALAGTAFGLEVACRCGAQAYCVQSYEHLLPHAGELIVIGGGVCAVGPADLYLGLAALGGPDPERARPHLEAALRQARTMGSEPWVRRITDLLETDDRPVLRKEGPVRVLSYAGTTAHLPDSKGLEDLAALVARPGTPVSALTLVGGTGDSPPQLGSDPALDSAARSAYRKRLGELDSLIAEWGDLGHAYKLQEAEDERNALVAELRRATGLGGRTRLVGDPGERARSTVTARIREALRRVEDVHPALGAHLRAAVRTGRTCVYDPGG